ncbi:hypothetical protein [Lyngbya sp. CCAP 1446/10]|nr:hypothetical protein [Lyngbya sp. CCAP 1446/10]
MKRQSILDFMEEGRRKKEEGRRKKEEGSCKVRTGNSTRFCV